MKTFYISFGQRFRHEKHPNDERIHPDGYVEIIAGDLHAAHHIAVEAFGFNWADLKDAEDFDASFYPRGCLFKL